MTPITPTKNVSRRDCDRVRALHDLIDFLLSDPEKKFRIKQAFDFSLWGGWEADLTLTLHGAHPTSRRLTRRHFLFSGTWILYDYVCNITSRHCCMNTRSRTGGKPLRKERTIHGSHSSTHDVGSDAG